MIENRIEKEIKIRDKIPKTSGGNRKVTKKIDDRIYMRTGVETYAQKYVTTDMVKFANDVISTGKSFTSELLKNEFPKEYSQGSCVFSMTGGILISLGEAECVKNGKNYEYIKK